ncbi:MAG: hypothetical protein LQ338_007397 [Usnochroma carphineum]|nr:MAG: hypothetical protein LQ338_007397 [Usnochroma carphineum]
MKTSRLARETAKIAENTDITTKRQTKSFAASIHAFAAGNAANPAPKQEDGVSDDSSSLSSLAPSELMDIEDTPANANLRKRKRGIESPSTTVTAASTLDVKTRTSPRKVKQEDGSLAKIKKGRKQPAKKVVSGSGEVTIHPPANWEEIYTAVQEMRRKVFAPVDTMGCETLAEKTRTPRVSLPTKPLPPFAHPLTPLRKQDQRFQTLIALMLSSQTKDTTTALAMRRLQTELPSPGLTLENILAVSPETLNTLIHAVGFHNNKTKYIKATALILKERYHSDIPDTVEGLISLPGVGPKMAYLCMSAAWGRTEGIGVDVHVHRITNLWGWHKTREPEETRKALESWLPREKWHEINHMLVGFGQTLCLPVGRRCGECTLSTRGLCPGAVAEKNTTVVKRRREREIVGEVGGAIKEEGVDVAVKEEDV